MKLKMKFMSNVEVCLYSEAFDKGHSKRGQTSQQGKSSPLKEDNLSTKDKTTRCPLLRGSSVLVDCRLLVHSSIFFQARRHGGV